MNPEDGATHNIEAEQALLGAIMLSEDGFWRVSDRVRPDDFCDPVHEEIFRRMGELAEADRRINPLTLAPFFGDKELVPGVTAKAYLARLVSGAITVAGIVDYADLVCEAALRRRLSAAASKIQEAATNPDLGVKELAGFAEDAMLQASEVRDTEAVILASDAAKKVMADAERAYREQGRYAGLSTGLTDLDEMLGPLLPGDLIVIGGNTSSGKTALAQHIAEHNAKTVWTVYETLEMTASNLQARSLSQASRVQAWRIESGRFNEQEYRQMIEGQRAVLGSKLIYVDLHRPPFARLRANAIRLARQGRCSLLVIDHLRFVQFSNHRMGLAEGTAEITAECKALAKQLGIPIILVSQFNREINRREDKRPLMSDLYGGAAIEQDADTVFFIHRPEYWLERSPPPEDTSEWYEWKSKMERAAGKAECILAKRRRGKGVNNCTIRFTKQFTEFSDYRADDPTQEEML